MAAQPSYRDLLHQAHPELALGDEQVHAAAALLHLYEGSVAITPRLLSFISRILMGNENGGAEGQMALVWMRLRAAQRLDQLACLLLDRRLRAAERVQQALLA